MRNTHRLTTISISYENYVALKQLGKAGDSFNDVLTELLKNRTLLQTGSKVGTLEQSVVAETSKGGCTTYG